MAKDEVTSLVAFDDIALNPTSKIKPVPPSTDAEIAASIKSRLEEAMIPVLALFDEAAINGMNVGWECLEITPPTHRFRIRNLRITKIFD